MFGVAKKEVSEPIVESVQGVLDQSGCQGGNFTSKTDQEPSIVAQKRAVSAARVGETVPIGSPVRASKSNGMMEGAIRVWQGQLQTIKHFAQGFVSASAREAWRRCAFSHILSVARW